MPRLAISFGVALLVLGLGGFALFSIMEGQATSFTALIPATFGVLLLLFGLAARRESLRMHAMHGAALIGLLGLAGTVPGVLKLIRWAGGTAPERANAVVVQSIMAVLCLAFVVLCVRSFIAARRARAATPD